VQLTATVRDTSGNPLPGITIVWSSSNSSVASVDTAGLVRGVAAGSATITATSDGVSGTSIVTVTQGGGSTGTTTPAGRCGQVIRVTNLNDAGPGSLRAALLTPGPRTVIFEVSGQINLNSILQIGDYGDPDTYANLSVYGQTAPSPGITIAGHQFAIRSNDVLIQHLRFRHGDLGNPDLKSRALIVMGPIARVVVDHVSVSWSSDDNMGVWAAPSDVTISNSISSESQMGMLIGDDSQRIAIIRNLFAHLWDRTPYAKGGSNVVWVNNFVYNSGHPNNGAPIKWAQGKKNTKQMLASVLSIVTKEGPTSAGTLFFIGPADNGSKIFLGSPDDNVTGGYHDVTGYAEYISSPPYPLPSPLTVLPSANLEAYIAANVGARPADRDPVDTRIINDIVNGTGRLIKQRGFGNEDENVVGGFPPLAHNRRVLTLPPNPHGDDDGDGYTNLEEWIHQFTPQVEGRN
jgi:pectate lyase